MSNQSDTAQAHIQAGAELVTLINVFTVDPDDQRRLVEAWQQATDQVMRHRPGFISASIHRSFDGTKVVNYAQWETREAFAAMFGDPDAAGQLARLADIGTPGPVLCDVVSVHLAGEPNRTS
jgi:heme-degrading monooxygenase HmoA